MSNLDFAEFARQYGDYAFKARLIFERYKRNLNKNLRHEIIAIEFHEGGCDVRYESRHCCNCSPERDSLFISQEELAGEIDEI